MEGLPAETEGLEDLLDEIDKRQRTCDSLVQEAVRLAERGNRDAAMQAISEAEQLWSGSETLIAVREDLERLAGHDSDIRSGRVPVPLQEALEDERYPAARTQIESAMRQGPISDEMDTAIRRFKRGRVRKAFLENIAAARRLYVLGHRNESRDHWLEAANWLPPGSHRARLREIAAAAGKGRLNLDVILLGLSQEAQTRQSAREAAGEAPPLQPTDTRIEREAEARRRRHAAVLVALFVILVLTFLILFWSLART